MALTAVGWKVMLPTIKDLKNKHDKTSKSQKWCSANRFVLQKQKKKPKKHPSLMLKFSAGRCKA